MTDPTPRRRASKRVLRVWAWVAGGLAFLAPFRMLEASPKPPSDQAEAGRDHRQVLVVRKITRVVVVREQPAEAPVRYVPAPSGSGSTPSTGTTAAPSSSTSASTAPVPPPPAPTTTGGS
jgi:hypothetical protein